MIAAAEVGSAPKPDLLQSYQAEWLWFCVWGDSYINGPTNNPPDVLKDVCQLVLLLYPLPSFFSSLLGSPCPTYVSNPTE